MDGDGNGNFPMGLGCQPKPNRRPALHGLSCFFQTGAIFGRAFQCVCDRNIGSSLPLSAIQVSAVRHTGFPI